jgi:hypothetical protein
VSLALLTTGATTLAGSDDLLAAFACGAAFAWDDWFTESISESNFSKSAPLLSMQWVPTPPPPSLTSNFRDV